MLLVSERRLLSGKLCCPAEPHVVRKLCINILHAARMCVCVQTHNIYVVRNVCINIVYRTSLCTVCVFKHTSMHVLYVVHMLHMHMHQTL